MNRRDFLSKIPHAMAIAGAGMFAAAKVLDAQPEVLHVGPKPELWLWRHERDGHAWYDIRETVVHLDGRIGQRNLGESCPFWLTHECPRMHRDQRLEFPNSYPFNPVVVPNYSDWA